MKIDLFNTVNYMQTCVEVFHKQDVEGFSHGFKGMNVNYELIFDRHCPQGLLNRRHF